MPSISNDQYEKRKLSRNLIPRSEVIDELHAAIHTGQKPLHDGIWGRATLEIWLALLDSSALDRDIELKRQS